MKKDSGKYVYDTKDKLTSTDHKLIILNVIFIFYIFSISRKKRLIL